MSGVPWVSLMKELVSTVRAVPRRVCAGVPGAASGRVKERGEHREVQKSKGTALGRQRVKKVSVAGKYAGVRWWEASGHSQEVVSEGCFSGRESRMDRTVKRHFWY